MKVVKQKADHLVRAQSSAMAVHCADTVRVTVGNKAEVVRVFGEVGRTPRIVQGNRLRVDAAE